MVSDFRPVLPQAEKDFAALSSDFNGG